MNISFPPLEPNVFLGVAAHPDDLEFGAAGTVAKLISEGSQGYYLILTNANKGSSDRAVTPNKLRDTRRAEQRAAGKILGLKDVFFCNYEDGCLECSKEVKCDITKIIRQIKPDMIITADPTMAYDVDSGYIEHSDHRAAGRATLDAIYPLARDHLSFPELLEAGLEPHKVKTVLMTHLGQENYYVDISKHIDTKLAAIAKHVSQFPDNAVLADKVRNWAERMGEEVGSRYAEGFVRLDLSL